MFSMLMFGLTIGFLLSYPVQAATVQASSCSQSAVQTAISSAAHGDTVTVPAGSCSWSGLSVNKAIHLKGAGTGQTNITLTGSNTVTKQSAGIVRISSFSFIKNGGGNESKGFIVSGSWKNAEPVIIENNAFTISGSGLFLLDVAGGVIIAGNSFTGGWDDSFIHPKNSGDSGNSWGSADTLGNRDTTGKLNHYVEDNTFYGGTNQGIDADDSTRVVYRYNDLTYSSFNTHGMATSPVGVRHFEVYQNRFRHLGGSSQIANQNWAIWIRGGTGVIFSNQIDDIAGSTWGNKPEVKLTIRGAEDARPQGACSNVSYPVPRQLGQNHNGGNYFTDPIYLWGNIGAVNIDAGWSWGNPCGFNFSTFFQWGRDGVNTGTAKPGYTPYTYPHPLRNGTTTTPPPPPDTSAPSIPTNLSANAISSSQINLSWNASTDDTAVSGYRVFRGGTQIATVAATTYSNTGLTAATTYVYAVAAYDAAGNVSGQSASVSATTLAVADTTPPIISAISATNISTSGATITWTTNEPSDSLVRYGTTPYTGSTPLNATLVTSHTVTLTGLVAGTLYNYRVESKDASGNLATSGNFTFTTASAAPPPSGGNTFYIDQSAGSDSNNGTSPSTPWRNVPGTSACSAVCASTALQPGNIVYFDRADTWILTGSPQGLFLVGGVTYIGDQWLNTGTAKARATLVAGNDFNDNGVVRFRDHATIPTVFKGFEVDVNSKSANGIDINHGFWSLMNGAIKRVQNVEVHHVNSRVSLGQYKYGIAMSNWGGNSGILENVEILDCSVHDVSRDGIILYPSDDVNSRIGNITVRGCEIYNTGQDPGYDEGHGIVVKGWVYNTIIEFNYVHNVDSSAIFFSGPENDGSQRSADNVHVRHNILSSQDNNGIIRLYKKGAKDIKVYSNIIFDNSQTGGLSLAGSSGTLNLYVYNNTFYNTFVDFGGHSSTVQALEFRNNIVVYGNSQLRNGSSITSQSNNLLVSAAPGMKNPTTRPTGFIGIYGTDLQPNDDGFSLVQGSAAMNAGAALNSTYNTSINSLIRPQGSSWDIGAYESGEASVPPPAPPTSLTAVTQ